MNIYKLLLGMLMGAVFAFLFGVIEYQLFTTSILGGIIGNVLIATIFFLLYKSNKHDAVYTTDEGETQ